MKCIDFDKAFSRFAIAYFREHAKEYANYDAMEEAVPQVYELFLNTEQAFLGNRRPGTYFDEWDDPNLLVNWMTDYSKQYIPVPDVLLERIASLGVSAEAKLMALLRNDRAPREARSNAAALLNQIGSTEPMNTYISWIRNREEEEDLRDAAADSLRQMGDIVVNPLINALDGADDEALVDLCGILSYWPESAEHILQPLLRLIRAEDANIALLAGYLGRLGDESALETLIDLALDDRIGYLDYIELRSAIEALGGDAPERGFDESDPAYEAVSRLQTQYRAGREIVEAADEDTEAGENADEAPEEKRD